MNFMSHTRLKTSRYATGFNNQNKSVPTVINHPNVYLNFLMFKYINNLKKNNSEMIAMIK